MSGTAGECGLIRAELGVYVLGAISPADRARVDRHLASCPSCRDGLAGLAGLPGLLAKVPPHEATAWLHDTSESLPGHVLDVLLRRVTRIRERRRLIAALAGALVVGLATATGLQASQAPAARPAAMAGPRWSATVTGSSTATGVWAAVRYASQPWGTRLEVQVTGIPKGTRCELVVVGPRGQDADAGGWIITAGSPPGWYPGSVPLQPASMRGFALTAGGKTLISLPAR
ncbi:MAG TPA: zf-HC2 domain-containing protein [Streptosporangiaceae bacterium]|nr:zf-HC2 domain-containing protein [Streptosporangiaceae bacterium]